MHHIEVCGNKTEAILPSVTRGLVERGVWQILQILTVESHDAEATSLPSGEKATAVTMDV